MQERGYDLADSAVEALSLKNVLRRVFLFLVFGLLLGLQDLIRNIDTVGRTGGAWYHYFGALGKAMWSGVVLALGSMWAVITNFGAYLDSHSWGSVVFTVFSVVFLVMFFYQPLSLFINIIDGRRGHATGVALRLFVTVIAVLVLSCIVFYAGDGRALVTPVADLNGSVDGVCGKVEGEVCCIDHAVPVWANASDTSCKVGIVSDDMCDVNCAPTVVDNNESGSVIDLL